MAGQTPKKAAIAYIILFSALLGTFLAWLFVRNFVQEQTRLKFQTEVTEVRVLIQERLQLYMDVLHGVQGLFAATESVNRDEWSAYIQGTSLRQKYPGVSSIGFIEKVSAKEKNRFTSAVRSDTSVSPQGYPGFVIYPEGERAVYFVANYLEPLFGNESLFGFDLASDPVLKGVLEKVRDSGELQATGVIDWIKSFKDKTSFMVFLPVYKKNSRLISIQDRRMALQGFVVATFETQNLFSDILFGRYLNPGIDLDVFEENAQDGRKLLYNEEGVVVRTQEVRKPFSGLMTKVYLNFSDRVWSLCFYAKSKFGIDSIGKLLPKFVLAGGLILSFLLFGIFQALSTSRLQAVRLAEEMTRDLRESEAVLRLRDRAISATSDGIVITDPNQPDDPIIYVNFGFEKLTGYKSEEVMGKNCRFLQGPDTDQATLERLRNAVDQKKECSVVIKNYRRNKKPFWNALSISPVFDAKGALIHFVGVQRDVTELRRAEEALIQRTEELKRSNRELEEFAYVASHDLQEPLRKIANYTELLVKRYKGKVDPGADKFIDYIIDGATRMQTLIRDLLTYSRSGRDDKLFESTDFMVVIKEALENLETAIQDSGAIVTTDPLPKVHANTLQMIQVLQNLIGNAIKYRGAEPPRVHVSAKTEGQNWLFSVKDNGIGIDPQYFDRIFVIFQRLHTRAEYKGTGIGLSICKKIVERHGGHIWVESAEGKGSAFYFTIPIRDL